MALDFPSSPTNGQLYTGSDGTTWKWDGAKWVSAGGGGALVSAQQLDLGTRLAAAGTKLNALGPVTSVNAPSGTVMTALDGAMNYQGGAAVNHTWNLPPVTPGAYLIIRLPNNSNSCTITPAGSDLILSPAAKNYTNASPMLIPPLLAGAGACVFLSGVPPFWIADAAAEIEAALGWVSHPYFQGSYSGATVALGAGWNKCTMDNVAQDSHAYWNAAGTCYQPKRAGRYRVTYDANCGANAGPGPTALYAAIWKNGAMVDERTMSWNGTTYLPYSTPLSITTIINMNGTTDFIEPYVYVAGSASPVLAGGNTNALTITYLGP